MLALLGGKGSENRYAAMASLDYLARNQQRDISGYVDLKAQYTAQQKQIDDAHASQAARQQELATQRDKINGDVQRLLEMRRKAYGSATSTASGARPAPPYVAGRAAAGRDLRLQRDRQAVRLGR